MALYMTNPAAVSMMTALEAAIDAGTAAQLVIYSGTVPADADAALSAQVILAELLCSATFGTVAANGNNARITAAAIAPDTSANNSGTASFWRLYTQTDKVTNVLQGAVGTASAELILNTTAITAGSQVSVTSFTIDLPEG